MQPDARRGGAGDPADAADRLLLDEAAHRLDGLRDGELVVLDDETGAVALGATERGVSGIRVHSDTITGERALARELRAQGAADAVAVLPLLGRGDPERLLGGARLVLLRLPRSLDRLDELAGLIAGHAASDVVVMGAGRVKHMSVAMNDVLGAWFGRVDVSHARQKSRVLTATGASPARTPPAPAWPRDRVHPDLGVTVVAHGGVFAGAGVDVGTRALLSRLDEAVPDAATVVDLACGSGVVAAWLATRRAGVRVHASDRSAAAAASARRTAEANGVADRVDVHRADGLEHLPDASERLVVLNPPFHDGPAIDTSIAARLFADAARVLVPGGELWCVWNSHLRYRGMLERMVGPTRQVARDHRFTVTASVARAR